MRAPGGPGDGKPWTFLTNHARVLICIARDPQARMRDMASEIDITERAAQLIIADLEEAGYITRTRNGRRNVYTVVRHRPLRHPSEAGFEVQSLITLFTDHQIHDSGSEPGSGSGPTSQTRAARTRPA